MFSVFLGLSILDALLLWAIARGRDWWVLKTLAVVLVLGFNFFVWQSGHSFKGWPTTQAPPRAAVFVSCFVIEPDQHQHGGIFLWLLDVGENGKFTYHVKLPRPRSFQLPYDRQLHAACEKANKTTASRGVGSVAFGRRESHAPPSPQGHGAQATRAGGHGHSRGVYVFYVLPPTNAPVKPG